MLDGINGMTDYLKTYGSELADKIKQQATPLFNPGDPWDDSVYRLRKKPYQAQGDAIMGLSKLLQDYDSAILLGEMGCGKTLIGVSVPYVSADGKNPHQRLSYAPAIWSKNGSSKSWRLFQMQKSLAIWRTWQLSINTPHFSVTNMSSSEGG